MIKMGLLGATGQMGQAVRTMIASEYAKRVTLVAQVNQRHLEYHTLLALLGTEVVIDFSSPEGMISLAKEALQNPSLPVFVVGSTGWAPERQKTLEKLAQKTLILRSSNFSLGMMAFFKILKKSTQLLEKQGYEPIIIEKHHSKKKDSPSGTALSLQRILSPHAPEKVQTHSIRGGDAIGTHEVTFYGPSESISFTHFAQDRSIFARGAMEAALWLVDSYKRGKKPGQILEMEEFFDEYQTR